MVTTREKREEKNTNKQNKKKSQNQNQILKPQNTKNSSKGFTTVRKGWLQQCGGQQDEQVSLQDPSSNLCLNFQEHRWLPGRSRAAHVHPHISTDNGDKGGSLLPPTLWPLSPHTPHWFFVPAQGVTEAHPIRWNWTIFSAVLQ